MQASELLEAYLNNVSTPKVSAAQFAEDGVLELPWVEARAPGYQVEAKVLSTGKIYKQTYVGVLHAENGKIKLLREALDTVAASKAFTKD